MKTNFKVKLSDLSKVPKEKLMIVVGVVICVVLTLWISSRETKTEVSPELELGLIVPKGHLVVPLEIMNAQALNSLVSKAAVVDIFRQGESHAIVECLRVIKLNAGEGPLFGAIVPIKMAGMLQEAFSRPKLRAALRTLEAGPTTFHLHSSAKPLLIEVPTGDDK